MADCPLRSQMMNTDFHHDALAAERERNIRSGEFLNDEKTEPTNLAVRRPMFFGWR